MPSDHMIGFDEPAATSDAECMCSIRATRAQVGVENTLLGRYVRDVIEATRPEPGHRVDGELVVRTPGAGAAIAQAEKVLEGIAPVPDWSGAREDAHRSLDALSNTLATNELQAVVRVMHCLRSGRTIKAALAQALLDEELGQ